MKKITCFLLSCFVLLSSLCFAAPPSFITITSPQDGSYLNNVVTIEAQLTQIPRVRSVKFYIDNSLVGEDTTQPYQYTWDTTSYTDGQHTIYASILQAPDRPGRAPPLPIDSQKITITVDNTPPLVSIINPLSSSFTRGTITTEAQVQDNFGISKVEFKLDDALIKEFAQSESYTYAFDTTQTSDGDHTFTVSAYDLALNKTTSSVIFAIDNTPPTGTIKINDDAQYTNSPQVTLNISAQDSVSGLDKMQFSNDGITYSTPEDYATSKSWDLSPGDGEKTVYPKFKDVAGNWSSPFLDVIILDTTAPAINITTPSNGYISTAQTITVSGTIDDNQARVNINGIQAQVLNGTFTAEGINLNLGQNTIVATATDLAGNTSSHSITVTYLPTTGLFIDITSPSDGAILNSSTITVSGFISDNTAQVTVNGITATISNNVFSASITLSKGINIITAKATKDTQAAEDTIEVILDQDPPSVNILTPDNNSTTRSNIIYGRVSDDAQSVTVNGVQAELLQNNYFLARAALTEGPNTIVVQATDKAGNTGQSSINVIYDTQTPKVTITSPLDNSTIDISPIKVEGTTTSDIQFILVNTSTAIIDNTTFIAETVNLDSTQTVITASGYDANNNIFSDSILIHSPYIAHYELQKVSGDATEDDLNRPSAGSNQTLIVKLQKNYFPASGEGIQFKITQGNGSLSNPYSFTDINGKAQIILTTDTDSDITNQVEAYPTNNPLVKAIFYVDTKPGTPSILTKITDDSITPVPRATIPLIVKLTDQYNNPIPDEQIDFQVTSGDGTLSSPTTVTNYYGEAKVNLTCPNIGLALTQIKASSNTNPSVSTTFNITTSAPLIITIDDIINKVNQNDSKIQDIKADITVTSNALFLPPQMQLKIWQKGDKQKVQELSPNPQINIRPSLQTSTEYIGIQREIISYDPTNNIYVIETKQLGQIEEYPYQILYIDYNKGVELKSEYYTKDGDLEMIFVTEAQDFVQIQDAWVFQKLIETAYEGQGRKELYRTENVYTNIQINTGIPDSEFQ